MKVRKKKLNSDGTIHRLSLVEIQNLIDKHQAEIDRINNLELYYRNKNPKIMGRVVATKEEIEAGIEKPNNKIPHPYAYYITTMTTGYFMGEPIQYKFPESYDEPIKKIFRYNDEAACNNTLSTNSSKFGYSVEQHYIDENSMIRFAPVNVDEIIYLVEPNLSEDMWCTIRHWSDEDLATGELHTYVQVYYEDYQEEFHYVNSTRMVLGEPEILYHPYGDVPFVIYDNNDARMGDYEIVIDLIDMYDQAESDTANDFEYFSNAYLKITGVTVDSEEAKKLKKIRVFNFPDKEGDASFLTKEINDTATENYKNRLDSDIHKFSLVPDMSDENFVGNASGVSIKYKLQGLEFLCSVKEDKFKKGLLRRIELINNILNIKSSVPVDLVSDTEIIFTRNTVDNLVELIENVNKLSGIISREGQLEMLDGKVIDKNKELERIEEANPFENNNNDDFYNKNHEVDEETEDTTEEEKDTEKEGE